MESVHCASTPIFCGKGIRGFLPFSSTRPGILRKFERKRASLSELPHPIPSTSSSGSSITGGMRFTPFFSQEWSALVFYKTQRALTRFIIYHQQEIDLPKCAWSSTFPLRSPSFHATHQRPSPPVRCRVPDCPEHWRISRSMVWAGTKLQCRFKREPRRMFKPRLIVFEAGALFVIARARPEPPGKVGYALQST